MTDKGDFNTIFFIKGDDIVELNDYFTFVEAKNPSNPQLIKKLNVIDVIVIKLKGINNVYQVDHFVKKRDFAYCNIVINTRKDI